MSAPGFPYPGMGGICRPGNPEGWLLKRRAPKLLLYYRSVLEARLAEERQVNLSKEPAWPALFQKDTDLSVFARGENFPLS